jgi:hypothetical protein
MDSSPPGDGGDDGGPSVPSASPDCTSPTSVTLSMNAIDLETTFTTDAGTATIAPPCASGAVSAEVFYAVRFSAKVYLYADTFGSSLDTVLFLLNPAKGQADCKPITMPTTMGDAVCSDNACGTNQSQMVAVLAPGNYVLGVGVVGSTAGTVTTHLQYALAASGSEKPLAQGSSMPMGQTVGSTGNIQNQSSSCTAAGPEDGYWWVSCPNDPGGMLTASTCGTTTWESVLATEIPGRSGSPYVCAIDSCLPGTSLTDTIPAGAGFRALIIDGNTVGASGQYTINVTRP